MNHKWSLLGVDKFYTAEEALTLLRNMSDFEDESTSGSEIEGDSSYSSEYAPEQQYQVRTDSNIQTSLPKETVNQNATKCALLADETATTSGEEHVASPPKVSQVKEISAKGKKATPTLVVNQITQIMHYWLMKQPQHQVRNMLLHPQKYLKSKKSAKGKKGAPTLVVNQNASKHALLADETATTSGEEHVASPPKVSQVKEISAKGKKAALTLVVNQNATECA